MRLLLLTGCRKSEMLTLQWDWLDFERGCMRLPDSKTGAKVVHLAADPLRAVADRTAARISAAMKGSNQSGKVILLDTDRHHETLLVAENQ